MDENSCSCKDIEIVEEIFGEISTEKAETHDDATKVKSYKMSNNYGMEVIVMSWGATIVSIKCPDKYGEPADIVLGFDNLDSYLDPRLNQMMGCIVGRCCGHVKTEGSYEDSKEGVACNSSFGRRVWEAHIEDDCRVVMSYLSPDGEDGYPGALLATIKFQLTRCNSLEIAMRAVSSKPTTVNLSHSCIFNLAGHGTGPDELRAHEISLNCDRWIDQQTDPASKTTADVTRPVGGTIMDLRLPRPLGEIIQQSSGPRLHHYLAVTRGGSSQPELAFVARILHPKTGRFLEIYSDQPGLDFYTGGQLSAAIGNGQSSLPSESEEHNHQTSSKDCLDITNCECKTDESSSFASSHADADVKTVTSELLPGKCGAKYEPFGGFGLLPQNRPTTAKIPLLPSATLRPGQVYYHDLVYKFGIQLDNHCVS